MLVLTRKVNQSIVIGDEIEISVLSVSRDKIRIGISAPRDVPVFRKEVLEGRFEGREVEVVQTGGSNGSGPDGSSEN